MVAPNNESVEYNLLLNAKQALAELQRFNKAAIDANGVVGSLETRIRNFEQVVAAEARKAGVAFEQQLAAFERLDNRLKTSKKGGVVGGTGGGQFMPGGERGGVNVFSETKIMHDRKVLYDEQQIAAKKSFEESNKLRNAEIDQLTRQTQAYKDTGHASQDAGKKSEEAGKKGAKGAHEATEATKLWNRAMSILVYDLISRGIQAVTQFFTQSIDQARQMEASLYRLQNAERILSKGGINISMGGLRKGIQDIKKLLPIFSTEDITQTVGALSVSTKQLGLTEEQILGLAKAAAILNVQSVESETLLQSQAKLVTALISPTAKSIGEYGISFGKVTMEAKAMELGILKAGEAVAKLTDAQKAQVKYAIILDVANSNIESLNGYLETNTAKLEKNTAAWKDLQTAIGQMILPFLPAVTAILDLIRSGVEGGKIIIALFLSLLGTVMIVKDSLWKFFGLFVTGKASVRDFVEYVKLAFKELGNSFLRSFFPDIPANAPKFVKKLLEAAGVGKFTDTPTAAPEAEGASIASPYGAGYADAVKEAEEKVTEIMKDAHQKQEDMARDHANKLADIARDYGRKLQDIAINLRDKIEDAQRDYGDKVASINSDIDKSIAEAKQDSYKKSVEAEKKYQDELKSLREKYLMDLEEALRARDARAILKLMRQYALDKQKALENRNEEQEEAKSTAAQKIRDLEEERKEKLALAARDLADKIKQAQLAADRERRDAALAHQRALADARMAYQRQLEEQRLFLQRKLQDLMAALMQEYQLTAAGQAAIKALIGSGGTAGGKSGGGQLLGTWSPSPNFRPYGPGMAEGGTFLATRPATINVGENRPEMITATPLGKPGKDISKVFTNGGMGGSSGQIELGLTLSPDLEARIISQTLSETANVILKINRSKS